MIQQFELIAKSVDRLGEKLAEAIRERDAARNECGSLKVQIQEKDLEIIRVRKEMQRSVENLEREKMSLQKEHAEMDQRMADLFGRIRTLLPEDTDRRSV
jgi:FtsZ-binding cell division protein ZapB